MCNTNIGKWMYNLSGNEIWTGEEFDTKEEAIKEAKKEIQEEGLDNISFEIGQIAKVFVSGVDVDFILENVAENTTNEVGEVGEDYLDDVTKEDRGELEEKLNQVLFKWIKEHRYEPNFFRIENTEKIEVEQEGVRHN
jgi:hypothetical protein